MELQSGVLNCVVGTARFDALAEWPYDVIIDSIVVWYETKPDNGLLNIGWNDLAPNELVHNFNLATLANHVPTTVPLVSTLVPANTRVYAKTSSATATPGVGGGCAIHYHRP